MKKRLIALLVCLVMVMMPMLAACGGGGDSAGGDEGGDAAAMKVGLITLHDENSTYDKNFLDAFQESCDKMGVEAIIMKNVPEGQECYDAAGELVDKGCSLIFSDSFGHQGFMLQAAKDNPDVQFVSCTGDNALVANQDNFHNAFASIYEGRYLAGVAAGMKLNEIKEAGKLKGDVPKMGYVGAFTYAEVVSGYTSFYLGAKSVCPDVVMDVTFTGSWYDETAEKEGANKLIQGGCDLISQHADSMGAPTACKEAGIPDVSYNGSTMEACPTGTLDTGSVQLTELNENVAAEGTAEKLEEVEAGLKDGSIHVFDTSTFTVDGKTLDSYKADVEADENYEHETEVISDGYFHESEYRSAPYFDLQIDGINLLDTNFG